MGQGDLRKTNPELRAAKFEQQHGPAVGTGGLERLVMWCDHVGSRGTLLTYLSWEETGRGGIGGGRSEPPGQREWKQFRFLLLIIVSKGPGVARWMMT